MKTLKKYGLHHGVLVIALSWAFCMLVSPLSGMIASGFGAGWFGGREEKEGENRGFRVFKPSTWKLEYFEGRDFLVPWAIAAVNIFIMRGM